VEILLALFEPITILFRRVLVVGGALCPIITFWFIKILLIEITGLERYPAVPRPVTVEFRFRLLTIPAEPRPTTVEVSSVVSIKELTYS
jgi:hypothetical protein